MDDIRRQAITEGALLGLYSFAQYRKPEYGNIEEMLIVAKEEDDVPVLERGIGKGRLIAEAVNLARDMGNEPANYMTPSQMAEVAKQIAGRHDLEIRVFDREDMEAMGMGALLGVAKGSNQLNRVKDPVAVHVTPGLEAEGLFRAVRPNSLVDDDVSSHSRDCRHPDQAHDQCQGHSYKYQSLHF